MDIIPPIAPNVLTSYTTFSNYLLPVDAYSKIPKLYVMEKLFTEEVVDKLDMFQSKFQKVDEFEWWDLERRIQRQMTNSRSLYYISSSRTSGNKRTVQSYLENVAYYYTLYFGTCESFGSVY